MFPDENTEPLYNSVDAALWYFLANYEYHKYSDDNEFIREIYPVLQHMVESFIKGTDFSVYMDEDYLIHAGNGSDQVTWMDVRINGICVTPRHGKPVEVNALWYNALRVMDYFSEMLGIDPVLDYSALSMRVRDSFNGKFWNEGKGCLYDVVDENDDSIRPNQIYAVSLPFKLLDQERSLAVVNTVYEKLYVRYGIRSLSRDDADYKAHYTGELISRDYAYHQGTAWGFLLGPFIRAYRYVHGDMPDEEIYNRFIIPAAVQLEEGCLGGYAEIFDGDYPHHHRGCYSQAWSVGEFLAVVRLLKNHG